MLDPDDLPADVVQFVNDTIDSIQRFENWISITNSSSCAVVERFLRTPFVRKDRIGDTMKSFEKLRTPPK